MIFNQKVLRNYKLNIADLPILTRNRFISSGEKEKLCSRKVVRIATASTSKMVALKMRIFHYILAASLPDCKAPISQDENSYKQCLDN